MGSVPPSSQRILTLTPDNIERKSFKNPAGWILILFVNRNTFTSTTTTTTTTVGGGINLDTPLIGDTKYQKQKGYAAELRKNDSQIRDRTKNTRNWKRLN